MKPSKPTAIAEFEIVRRLGAGGMAEVFLAKKLGAEGTYKLLVLKRILPAHGESRRFRTMFIEEARLATRLNHPNVVQVYEFQDFGNEGLLLAMEYVEGRDLGHLVSAAKARAFRLPPWLGAWIIAEAAKGLHYAHDKRDEAGQPLEIVHRDVSPQNILVSFEGAVKIADFGIASARLFSEEQGVLKGKFGYMSPEQARGEALDRRSDIYALGVVLWELLAGRPLHGGLGGEALLDIVRSGIVEPLSSIAPDTPRELAEIVMRALDPARGERFATARELSAAIGRALVKQGELVDASTLEVAVAELASREDRSVAEGLGAGSGHRADDAQTQAAVPHARSLLEHRVRGSEIDDGSSPPKPPEEAARREVRHVAVIRMHVHAAQTLVLPRRMVDRLRGMLDDLAFKRGIRWTWSTSEAPSAMTPWVSALATAGLAANPSRAATDAAQLALDVHETIAGFKDDLPDSLAASIGIARGLASGVRDAQGHLVRSELHEPGSRLADMLCRTAPPGKTWASGGVYRLVRREFRWGDVPPLRIAIDPTAPEVPPTLKVYELVRSLSRDERVDSRGAKAELVGRETEKRELHAAFQLAIGGRAGAGQVVCRAILGEMGIGKTALVGAFGAELPQSARLVLVECTPVTLEAPHAGLAELVRQAVGTTEDEPFDQVETLLGNVLGAVPGGSRPDVARLAELATNRTRRGEAEGDAHAHRKHLVSGIRGLLAAIASAQPLVLVIEGMQWCDNASLDVLTDAVHFDGALPLLVLFVARLDDRLEGLLAGAPRIALGPLSASEQVRLVEGRLAVEQGARSVCDELLPKVGGNPFFLLEMVDALLERGALEIREAAGEDGSPVSVLCRTALEGAVLGALPSTLEQLVGDRLRELPAAEHAIVEWLAIAGGPLSAGDIVRLMHEGSDADIGRLCARGVCDRKGEVVDFRHPIAREVAYAALDGRDRVVMHRRLGEHLATTSLARGLSAAIVARHLAKGRSFDRAAYFYAQAGAAARGAYQTRAAIQYYRRAASYLGPRDKRRLPVHEALENAYRMLGSRRERRLHLEALRRVARHVATPRAVCLGLLRIARYDLDEGRLAQGVIAAEQAARIAQTHGLRVFGMEAEARVSELLRELGDVKGALAACDRALAASEPGRDRRGSPSAEERVPPRQLGEVIRLRGTLLLRVGRVGDAVNAYADAIAIFRGCGGRRLEARAKAALSCAMYVQGRYEDAIALAVESIRINVAIGVRFQIARSLTHVARAYHRLGDAPRALAYLKRAREVHDRYGDPNGATETLLVSAEVVARLGDASLSEAYLREAAALSALSGNAYDRPYESVVRAVLARACGDAGAAVHHAMAAQRAAEKMALVDLHLVAMALEAAARVDLGDVQAATLGAEAALGALSSLEACEYALDVRGLSAYTLERAASPAAADARAGALAHAHTMELGIRDARLRRLFEERWRHGVRVPFSEHPPKTA